jgi:hypothetical protein
MGGAGCYRPGSVLPPEPEEYAAAKAKLDARGKHMSAFLRVCLRWLDHDPDQALAILGPLWPDPRPSGRPSQHAHDTGNANALRS